MNRRCLQGTSVAHIGAATPLACRIGRARCVRHGRTVGRPMKPVCKILLQGVCTCTRGSDDTAPFKLAKDPENQTIVDAILYRCAEAIRIAACLLEAVIPDHVDELRRAWHLDVNDESLEASCVWGRLQPGTAIDKIALFPRIEVEDTSDA